MVGAAACLKPTGYSCLVCHPRGEHTHVLAPNLRSVQACCRALRPPGAAGGLEPISQR